MKEVFLEVLQNSHENICNRIPFLIKLLEKETLAQVLSCELCEISNDTFSYRTPPVAASAASLLPNRFSNHYFRKKLS